MFTKAMSQSHLLIQCSTRAGDAFLLHVISLGNFQNNKYSLGNLEAENALSEYQGILL